MRKPPQGVSEGQLRQALAQFAGVVGAQWVFSSDEDLAAYDDPYSPALGEPDKERRAAAAVAPASVEQVQEIVRIAGRSGTPLYAVSTGRNLGYGGASPNLTGSVVLDLKRMNRIISVDAADGTMIVEPGVSFIDVQRYLDENGIDLVPSYPGPGWGSPIGNALEHGVGNVYTDNFSAVMGLEVVLANGEVLRTGRGGLPGSPVWPVYNYGFGPHITGMFSQSNFGVVTKGCFRLRPRWEVSRMLMLNSPSEGDLDAMIAAFKDLRNQEVVGLFGFGAPIRDQVMLGPKRAEVGGAVQALNLRRDGGTREQWEALASKAGVPVVQVMGGLRGPEPIVSAQLDYVRDVLRQRKVPGELVALPPETVIAPPTIDFGVLATTHFDNGHFIFSPIIRQTREDFYGINLLIRNVMLDEGREDIIRDTGWWGSAPSYERAMMLIMGFKVHNSPEENARTRDLFVKLARACGEKGWGEYRSPVMFHDEVMAQFSFNDAVLRRFSETVYDALDPQGILSPGKSGIWPRHMRQGGGLRR